MRDLWGRKSKPETKLPLGMDRDTALILSLIVLLKNEENSTGIILALLYILS